MKKNLQPVFHLEKTLTSEQREYFRQYGIIQFGNFIDKSVLSLLISEVEKVQAELLENGVKKINGIPLKFGRDANGEPLIQRIAFASHLPIALPLFTIGWGI